MRHVFIVKIPGTVSSQYSPFRIAVSILLLLYRLFQELKRKYNEERTVFSDKIDALEGEKQRLVAETTDLSAENEKFQTSMKSLENAFL